MNFNKKYDVVQNFLLKDLQSQTKVVGILPPNAVLLFYFLLLARPLVLQMLFIAVNSPNLAHQHWEGKKIVKRPNNFDWDCRFVCFSQFMHSYIPEWNVLNLKEQFSTLLGSSRKCPYPPPPPPLHGGHFSLRPPTPWNLKLDLILFGNNIWVKNCCTISLCQR